MEIEYNLTEADLIALARYQVEHSPTAKRRFGRRRYAYAAGFLMLALGDYVLYHDVITSIGFALLAVLVFALFPIYLRWLLNRSVPRLVRERLTPSAVGPRTLRLTAEGLEQIVADGASQVGWQKVDGVAETLDYVFVAIEGTFSVIIPKSQLDARTLTQVLDELRRRG